MARKVMSRAELRKQGFETNSARGRWLDARKRERRSRLALGKLLEKLFNPELPQPKVRY